MGGSSIAITDRQEENSVDIIEQTVVSSRALRSNSRAIRANGISLLYTCSSTRLDYHRAESL